VIVVDLSGESDRVLLVDKLGDVDWLLLKVFVSERRSVDERLDERVTVVLREADFDIDLLKDFHIDDVFVMLSKPVNVDVVVLEFEGLLDALSVLEVLRA